MRSFVWPFLYLISSCPTSWVVLLGVDDVSWRHANDPNFLEQSAEAMAAVAFFDVNMWESVLAGAKSFLVWNDSGVYLVPFHQCRYSSCYVSYRCLLVSAGSIFLAGQRNRLVL